MKVTVACTSECTGRTNEILYVNALFYFIYLSTYLLVNAFKKRDMTTGPRPASLPKRGSKTLTQNQLRGSLMRMLINETGRLPQGYAVSLTTIATAYGTQYQAPY